MRAKDFLTELWTKPYELTQKKWGGRIEYLFTTSDGRAGTINFDDTSILEYSGVVIHFYIDGYHGTSGRGDAIAIFSTVIAACKDWFSRHSPDFVVFESDDQKKLQLYARIADALMKQYQQFSIWTSSEFSDAIWDVSGEGVEEDMLVYVKRNLQLNEFLDDREGDDGEGGRGRNFAYEDGLQKGFVLADGATLERAMKINYWSGEDIPHFISGFIQGRRNKIAMDKRQYGIVGKLMKDGSIKQSRQVKEFLDDRRGDDGEGISQIVTITDRLLQQGYRVDLHVVGAMGRVYRADFDQTGFTPNGALAFKRKTRAFIRPFNIDDDDKYDFELVGPKHYKIVDTFTRADKLNEFAPSPGFGGDDGGDAQNHGRQARRVRSTRLPQGGNCCRQIRGARSFRGL